MTITLPDEMRDAVEQKAMAAGFGTVAEYVTWLLLSAEGEGAAASFEDFGFAGEAEMEAKLLASINSGPAVEVTPEFWVALRKQVADKVASRTHP